MIILIIIPIVKNEILQVIFQVCGKISFVTGSQEFFMAVKLFQGFKEPR
jgi:hypothetical protein